MRYLRKEKDIKVIQRGGAVEACWAHNPEDGRSKLLSATFYSKMFSFSLSYLLFYYLLIHQNNLDSILINIRNKK